VSPKIPRVVKKSLNNTRTNVCLPQSLQEPVPSASELPDTLTTANAQNGLLRPFAQSNMLHKTPVPVEIRQHTDIA